jgi:hypothetical protein
MAEARGVQVPAGVVDQHLRRLILRNAVEQHAHLCRIIQIRGRDQGQEGLLDDRHEAARRDAAPGRLDRDLGDAHGSCFALQPQ